MRYEGQLTGPAVTVCSKGGMGLIQYFDEFYIPLLNFFLTDEPDHALEQ